MRREGLHEAGAIISESRDSLPRSGAEVADGADAGENTRYLVV